MTFLKELFNEFAGVPKVKPIYIPTAFSEERLDEIHKIHFAPNFACNRNKLIVFVGNHFGIFFSHEVFMLAGIPVHDAEKEFKLSRADIYTHYTGSHSAVGLAASLKLDQEFLSFFDKFPASVTGHAVQNSG